MMTIYEIVEGNLLLPTNFDMKFLEGTGYKHLWDGEDFLEIIVKKFGNRVYPSNYETIASISNSFTEDYKKWSSRMTPNIKRIYDMMIAEYNPIENYDRHETGEIIDTMVNGERVNNSEAFPKIHQKTSSYVYGDNSEIPVPESFTETSFEYPEGVSSDKAISTMGTYTDTNTKSFNDYRIHGNIGVTTPEQMISAELKLRMKDWILDLITEFIDDYTLYIG